MGSKTFNKNQVEMFDGYAIQHYNAQFAGKFDPDEINSENITYDDHVCFIVMARAGEVRVKPDKDDELVRTNVFNVLRVVQVSPDLAEKTLQVHSQGTGTPQLPLSKGEIIDQLSGAAAGPNEEDEDDEWELPEPPTAAAQVKVADPALRDFLYSEK
jgi:hypothetical protein